MEQHESNLLLLLLSYKSIISGGWMHGRGAAPPLTVTSVIRLQVLFHSVLITVR